MNYTKDRLPNYKAPNGLPALMETNVNQTWTIQQSTTGLLTPLTTRSTSSPPLPPQGVPQEQLPSSSALSLSPGPILAQPRKSLKTVHDLEIHQQQQPRKRLRILANVTLDKDNNVVVKPKDVIQLNREDDGDHWEALSMLERLKLVVPDNNTPDMPLSKRFGVPEIRIANRKGHAETQGILETNIHDIFRIFKSVIDGTFSNLDFEMSQQNFYEICSFACSAIQVKDIFTVVSEALYDNIEKIGRKMEALASEKVNFLSLVVLGWKQCMSVLVKINDLFNPLNSKYMIKETKHSSLFQFGKEMYIKMISTSNKIKTRTITSLTHLITCQRRQIPVSQDLITATLQIIYENLPVYVDEFGQELAQSTRKFYQKCASTGLSNMTIERYIIYALKLIVYEPTARYDYLHYIPDDIQSPSKIALEELLSNHPDHISKCFELTVDQGQEQLLKALYQLFSHHGDISLLQTAFEQYIQDECDVVCSDYRTNNTGQIVGDHSQCYLFVSDLLGLKSRLNSILDHCFDSNDAFRHIMRRSFEVSINRDESSSAQHIATYMNERLESITVLSSTTHSSELKSLDQCIDLFRNLQAEDVFKCYYKAYLARRLLKYRNPAALTKEMDMTERLESECGVDFARDLVGMINEVRISQLRMASFEESASTFGDESRMELNVNVLSGENWSIPLRKEELRLSSEMLDQQRCYNNFYHEENTRGELTWMASLSTCVVNASYPNCTIELHTTQYQAMILLLFNDQRTPNWTVKRISQRTGIGEDDIMKSLETLTSPETQLLVRRQPTAKIATITTRNDKTGSKDNSDTFIFNRTFNNTQTKIDLPNILEELLSTSIKVMTRRELFNRQERLQASIMKTLKKHKELDILDIYDIVKTQNKSGRRKLLIGLPLVIDELKVLVKRGLIRNTTNDIYQYCEE